MSLNDPLSNALSKVMNAETRCSKACLIKPVSAIIRDVFTQMNQHQYVGSFDIIPDNKGDIMQLHLLGAINSCGAIKPRSPVRLTDYEKYEKRYLPAKDFGILFVSTSHGIMTHIEAKKRKLGGKLIAFVY